MVTKELENILGNKVSREGFFNNGKWYYLSRNKKTEEYNDDGETPTGRKVRQMKAEEIHHKLEQITESDMGQSPHAEAVRLVP